MNFTSFIMKILENLIPRVRAWGPETVPEPDRDNMPADPASVKDEILNLIVGHRPTVFCPGLLELASPQLDRR